MKLRDVFLLKETTVDLEEGRLFMICKERVLVIIFLIV